MCNVISKVKSNVTKNTLKGNAKNKKWRTPLASSQLFRHSHTTRNEVAIC